MKHPEAERALIGIALRDPEALSQAIAAGVDDAAFQTDRGQCAWRALMAADRGGFSPDLVTVHGHLQALSGAKPEDMASWLADCLIEAPIAQNTRYFIDAVLNGSWLRRLGVLSSALQREIMGAMSAGVDDVAPLKTRLAAIVEAFVAGEATKADGPAEIQAVIHELADVIDQRIKERREGRQRGVTTGLKNLDLVLGGGMRPGAMYTVAARTGVGKTMFAVNAATAAARAGSRVGFWSTEQLKTEMAQRLLSRVSRVVGMAIDTGNLGNEALDHLHGGLRELHTWSFAMDDQFGASFDRLAASARRMHRRQPFGLIVADYIQQLTRDGERFDSRHAAISSISRGLKQLAVDLAVPVLVLAQINREGAKAGEAEAHHVKDSGSIEQDSDALIIINVDGEQTYLDVKKNRHGPAKRLLVKREMAINLFSDDNVALTEV